MVAIQHGQAIFNLQDSFHAPEEGLSHRVDMPEVPAAETLPDFKTRMAPPKHLRGEWYERPRPIDIPYLHGLSLIHH